MWQTIWTLVTPTNAAEFWAMVLAIGTVALAIVAYRGLRSLKLTKTDMLTRAERDARECAITRCKEMAHDILVTNGDLLQRLAAAKMPVFVKSANDVRFDPDKAEHLADAGAWLQRLPQDVHKDCIGQLNRLEAWAMYFTKAVADHDIAFGPCAPVYCSMVVQYYAVLLSRRAGHSSGKFPNTVELFKSWRERLESEKSGVKMDELVRQLSDLQARRTQQAPLPRPLGTRLDD